MSSAQIRQGALDLMKTNNHSYAQTTRQIQANNAKQDQVALDVINNATELRSMTAKVKGNMIDIMA